MISEYGISDESLEDFANRNHFIASPKYPQHFRAGKEINFSDKISFLPIDWESVLDIDTMFDEAKRLEKHYVPHRTHESHSGWSSLVIHGISSVHTESSHTYGFTDQTAPYRWTDISDLCPTITEFFKNQFDYDRYFRIRIMKLSPGGFIIPHQDSIDVKENHIGPINFALNDPEGCNFYMDDIGILPWKPGRMIKLNLFNVHAVWNRSRENRYHIIVHGHAGKSWPDRIFKNYNIWKNIYA